MTTEHGRDFGFGAFWVEMMLFHKGDVWRHCGVHLLTDAGGKKVIPVCGFEASLQRFSAAVVGPLINVFGQLLSLPNDQGAPFLCPSWGEVKPLMCNMSTLSVFFNHHPFCENCHWLYLEAFINHTIHIRRWWRWSRWADWCVSRDCTASSAVSSTWRAPDSNVVPLQLFHTQTTWKLKFYLVKYEK